MSGSYQKNPKRKTKPAPEELKPLQIDETIVVGQSSRVVDPSAQDLFQSMTEMIERLAMLEQLESDFSDSDGLILRQVLEEDPNSLNAFQVVFSRGEDGRPFDVDQFEERVAAVLKTDNLMLDRNKLKKYLAYLKQAIQSPCYLTGGDVFEWEEEHFQTNHHSTAKYEQLKQDHASHTDVFLLKKFASQFSLDDGLYVEVERTSDHKSFTLPLIDLVAADPDSENYPLIDDYCVWFVNYQD
ncbi:MAG: hypothetical protein ACFBSC_06490 [Microcoleaceae cyanobacterium]